MGERQSYDRSGEALTQLRIRTMVEVVVVRSGEASKRLDDRRRHVRSDTEGGGNSSQQDITLLRKAHVVRPHSILSFVVRCQYVRQCLNDGSEEQCI